MKKIISLLLTFCFIAGTIPVMAKTDTAELETIILSVKDRIGNMEEYEDFSANERQGADGSVSYSLRWSDNSEGYKSAYVNVTSEGIITSYSKSEEYSGETGAKIRNIDRADIMNKAQLLVNELNPSLLGELVLKDNSRFRSLWDLGYSFEVQRVVNGITVPECSGSVTVDEKGEEITYFYMNYYQNAEFEDGLVIHPSEAQKAFLEKSGLILEYYKEYSEDENIAVPVYVFKDTQTKISAIDGSAFVPVKSYNGVLYRGEAEGMAADKSEIVMNSAMGATLSKTELGELDKISGLLTKEEGVKLIFDNPYIAIDSDTPLMSYNLDKEGENRYIGRFYFGEEHSQVSLDMKTGEVQSFYIYRYGEDENKAITEEKAEALKAEGAAYLAGEKFKEYRYDGASKFYTRYVNEIPFRQDTINVRVSSELGIINAYSINYSTCEFKSPDNVISPYAAGKMLFSQMPYTVVYERHVEDNKTVFKLIYDFDNSFMRMDAFSGEITGISGEDKPFEGYTDISGHYAEDIINTLALYGIRTEGSEFTPDSEITQNDFAKLLSCIVRRFDSILLKSESSEAATLLVDNGIIKKENYEKDAPVSRLEAAKMTVRAIGGEDFALLDGIYNNPFNDVTEGVGYVSILYGMGVFKGDGVGNFNPDRNITYAEAAIIIYNYLTR